MNSFNLWDEGVPEALKAIGKVITDENYNACCIGGLAVSIHLLKGKDKEANSKVMKKGQYSRNVTDIDIIYFGKEILSDIAESLRNEGFYVRRGDIFSPDDFHQLYAYLLKDKGFYIPIHTLKVDGCSPDLNEVKKTIFNNAIKNSLIISLYNEIDKEPYAKLKIPAIEDLLLTKLTVNRKKDENDIVIISNFLSENFNKDYLYQKSKELGLEIPYYLKSIFENGKNRNIYKCELT